MGKILKTRFEDLNEAWKWLSNNLPEKVEYVKHGGFSTDGWSQLATIESYYQEATANKRIIEWMLDNTHYAGTKSEPLFVQDLRQIANGDEVMVAQFLELLDAVCKGCWNAVRGCGCDNDD